MTAFDRWSGTYTQVVERSIAFAGKRHGFYLAAKADLLLELAARLGPPERVRTLDVGCGPGVLHPYLRSLRALTGIDASSTAIDHARRANPDVDYAVADARSLPFDADAFDLSFTVCVLHHVERGARPAVCAELARVTRPGGIVAVVEHNPLNPLTRLVVARCALDEDAALLREGETRRLLAGAGLALDAQAYFLFVPTTRLRRLERRLARVPLGAQYLVAARA